MFLAHCPGAHGLMLMVTVLTYTLPRTARALSQQAYPASLYMGLRGMKLKVISSPDTCADRGTTPA